MVTAAIHARSCTFRGRYRRVVCAIGLRGSVPPTIPNFPYTSFICRVQSKTYVFLSFNLIEVLFIFALLLRARPPNPIPNTSPPPPSPLQESHTNMNVAPPNIWRWREFGKWVFGACKCSVDVRNFFLAHSDLVHKHTSCLSERRRQA